MGDNYPYCKNDKGCRDGRRYRSGGEDHCPRGFDWSRHRSAEHPVCGPVAQVGIKIGDLVSAAGVVQLITHRLVDQRIARQHEDAVLTGRIFRAFLVLQSLLQFRSSRRVGLRSGTCCSFSSLQNSPHGNDMTMDYRAKSSTNCLINSSSSGPCHSPLAFVKLFVTRGSGKSSSYFEKASAGSVPRFDSISPSFFPSRC